MTHCGITKSKVTSSKDTDDFCSRLMGVEQKRGMLGKGNQYDPIQLYQKPSVISCFDGFVRQFIVPEGSV